MTKNKIIAGVIGDPISHSLSPRLHGFWLKKYGIAGEYKAFHVVDSELEGFIKSLREEGISGVNVTVPHKERVMEYLDHVDDTATRIGAVNTIYVADDGKTIGTNTDGYGFLTHLKSSAPDWSAQNGSVTILGAGGAARAVLISLLDDGVPEIRLTNRTASRAEGLADEIGDDRIKVRPWEERDASYEGCALLINVTTLGMTGQRPLETDLTLLPKEAVVYDIVYNPLETRLLKQAKERGNQTVDGLGMLLHQAAPGFQNWFGKMPEVDEALRDHLLEVL